MRNTPLVFTLCLLLTLAGIASFGQSSLTTSIDSLLKTTSPRSFNGVVLVAQYGHVQYAKAQGFADMQKKQPLTIDDQFIIGSISKQTTAVLVLQELDERHVSLQEPLSKYLPDLKENWADSVTIHHLLNHTSGIIGLDQPLAFKPGTQFAYSPIIGYQLLAEIVEKTSGESYEVLITRLFKKCGMRHTTIPALYNQGKLVSSYTEKPDGSLTKEKYSLKEIAFVTPSGGVMTTAKDLLRWNECLHQGKLLTPKSYQLMTTRYITRPNHRWGDLGYGYGIQVSDQNDHLELSHSGALLGFIATNIYEPASQTSIVVLENVAPDFEDMQRAFFFHDQVRDIVKASRLRE